MILFRKLWGAAFLKYLNSIKGENKTPECIGNAAKVTKETNGSPKQECYISNE